MSTKVKIDELVDNAARRFVSELQIASLGLPQRVLADRAGLSQPEVSRIFHGERGLTLDTMIRLTNAVGHRFWFKLLPNDGVRLRDSGQLSYAELVRGQAHASWRFRFEVPVAPPPDRRAADVVFEHANEVNILEIELALLDFQAQLRAAHLKREALVERLGRPVNLLIGIPDTAAARRVVQSHAALIASALPIPSRKAWAAIRSGEGVGGDALLWIRRRT